MILSKASLRLFAAISVFSLAAPPAFAAAPVCSRIFAHDEFAWLESGSVEKKAWVQSQTGRVNAFLKNSPNRTAIEKFMTNLSSPPNLMDLVRGDGYEIRIVDRGLGRGKSVDVEIVRGDEKQTLLSSYDFKRNNSSVPVELFKSPDGGTLLVKLSHHGSLDSFVGVLIDIKSGKRLATLENMDSGSPVWMSRDRLAYDEAGAAPRRMGVDIKTSEVRVAERMDPLDYRASQDGQWLFAYERIGKDTVLRVTSAEDGASLLLPPMPIVGIFKTTSTELWMRARAKDGFDDIIRLDLKRTKSGVEFAGAERIVHEEKRVISQAAIVKDRLMVSDFMGDDRALKIYDLSGRLQHELRAPGCCAASFAGFEGNSAIHLILSSPARQRADWMYEFASSKWFLRAADGSLREADPAREMMSDGGVDFVTTYHSYKSKDGTEIPVRITHRKDMVFNGKNPALLEGYGGFGMNNYFHPEFNPMRLEFLRRGGVAIAPALRGSTFFGPEWHDQGRALNKQNVIDDFIGAAEWAIRRKLTTNRKIAISGASHGGLLVGASLVQRPKLFGLALPQFGPLDFSRKPTLDPLTTPYQVSEYGDLYKDPVAILKSAQLSPFLNAKPATYPTTVVITGQKDSRVNPDHSYRFAAQLQASQRGKSPVLMYSLKNSGHWMMSEDRQDVLGWRSNVTYWTLIFDFFKMRM